MREGIHPEYNHDVVVKCACGNTLQLDQLIKS